jgi:ACS family glucarate transporter-like MFS transporter
MHLKKSRYINQAELNYITDGGALVEMDQKVKEKENKNNAPKWQFLSQLLKSRMLIGVYIA